MDKLSLLHVAILMLLVGAVVGWVTGPHLSRLHFVKVRYYEGLKSDRLNTPIQLPCSRGRIRCRVA